MEQALPGREEGLALRDLAAVPWKRRRLVAGIVLTAALAAVAAALLLPPIYRAETKILPPQQGSAGAAAQVLSQLGGGLGGLFSSALGVKTQSELYVEMLKTRTVLDALVDRFELHKLYGERYREDTRRRLLKALLVRDEKKSGIITLSVEDRDPARAAAMANAFVEELRKLSGGLAVTEAAQRRLFFEERMGEAKRVLASSEERMRGFQERTGALQVADQARAVIEGLAYLRAQAAAKEVELKVARSYATAQNPDVQRVEEELSALRSELARLEGKGGRGHDPLMPTGRIPAVGAEYFRNLRELKYHETLYELLAKQYEMARLDEARDAAVIQVIDRAVPPGKKAKPLRGLIVILGTAAGMAIAVLAAFFLEYLSSAAGVVNGPEAEVPAALSHSGRGA